MIKKYTRLIVFKDKDRKPIKITEDQYRIFRPVLNRDKFIECNDIPLSTSSIDTMPKIKEEPLLLAEPEPKPISKSVFEKLDKEIKKLKTKYNI